MSTPRAEQIRIGAASDEEYVDPESHLDSFVDLPTGIRLCYRDEPATGSPTNEDDDLPVVLVAGLSLDLTSWSSAMLEHLRACGRRVIRLDNRDAGRSTHLDDHRVPSTIDLLRSRAPADSYTLEEMADDVVGLLDHLALERVHLVGMSMGGMISQTVTAAHPERVATLTSIFSTTGDTSVGQPAKSTLLRMARRPPRTEYEQVQAHLGMAAHLAGRAWPPDVEREVAHALRTWRRGVGPRNAQASTRQIAAIHASGDRTAAVRTITAPTLVIHGDRDPMVATTGGHATHRAIEGSRLVVIKGMGHHFGPGLDVKIAEMVVEHVRGASPA